MDREILFRAKRIDNGEWAEGLPSYAPHGDISELEIDVRHRSSVMNSVFVNIDPETVCQYTGLTDENGEKIFEGDICHWIDVAWGKFTGVVRYGRWEQDGSGGEYAGTECIGWYLEVSKVKSLMPDVYTGAEAEQMYPEWMRTISIADNMNGEIKGLAVIGNIFDSPELLKEDGDE